MKPRFLLVALLVSACLGLAAAGPELKLGAYSEEGPPVGTGLRLGASPSEEGPPVGTGLRLGASSEEGPPVGTGLQPGAQQPAPQQPTPTFRAGVNAVRVDVIVTDRRGTPVDNLTADDFDLTEDGKPQKVDTARLIRVQAQQEPGGEAPREIHSFDDEATELGRDDIRIIVLFLDDYHVSRAGSMNLHGWLRRFINEQVGAYDVVALMYPLTPTSALTFTRDKFALTAVTDRFEGRRGDYTPRNDLEANYGMESPYRVEEIRAQVVGSALKALCYRLGTFNEGRKNVVVVAESLALSANDATEVIDAANRNNVAFYPISAQGVGATFGAYDILQSLAYETNGRLIAGRNDIGGGLASMLRDSSAYYLLGYTSEKGADGKFHEIKVRVKKPDLEVRARKGYWAPTAAEAARALQPPRPSAPREVTNSLGSLAEPRDRAVRTWVGMSRGEGGRTRVTFVWEAAVPGSGGGDRPGRVSLVASSPAGTFFDGPVEQTAPAGAVSPTSAPRIAPGTAQNGRAVFDVPPGKVQLKLEVQAAPPRRDVLESSTREIAVPDLSRGGVVLSTPAVFVARTPREVRAASDDPATIPTASRQFLRTERLLIRCEAYAAAGTATIAARLLNQHGDAMASLPVAASDELPGVQTIDLPLAAVARGDYVIEITARGQAGEAKELVAIRVTG